MKIILNDTKQEKGRALDGCNFSLDGAFLSEKKSNIGSNKTRDGASSGRMTLCAR